MDQQVNIPAPPTFKLEDANSENSKVLIVLVPQGDVEATAKADYLKKLPRKVPVYTKVPVPETDTGGWVEYTQARE